MISSVYTMQGRVSASTATAITLTPGVDTFDRPSGGAAITTVVINGTGLAALGARVGDWLCVRVEA